MQINFKQCNSGNYTKGRTQNIKYLVIHYTSNKGDTAKNNADYFAREVTKSSAHYFVDENEVWQSVNDTDTAWHCGAKNYAHPTCRNANSIGIEICMNDRSGNVRYSSIETAVRLAKEIITKYNIPIDNVLRHYDITLKNCPLPMIENEQLWINFKNALINEEEDEMKNYKWLNEMPSWSQDTFTRMYQAGVISLDKDGAMAVQESSIQPMIWIDRLCGGHIEMLPQAINYLLEQKYK